jgi:glycosyltransferase involved in cell wall biosynthesis
MEEGLISIVIPMYNSANYIEQLLDSISNQTYKNFEIIIVDDGSTDNSVNIVNKYLSESCIKYCITKQKNNGPSSARNTGIGLSSGEYIVFVDSDDVLHPDYLAELFAAVHLSNTEFAFCLSDKFYDLSKIKFDLSPLNKKDIKYYRPDDLAFKIAIVSKKVGNCTCIYKKTLVDKYKIKYLTKYKYGEDIEFLVKYLSFVNMSIIEIPRKLYFQRLRKGSLVSKESFINNFDRYMTDSLETKYRILDILKKFDNKEYKKLRKLVIPRVYLALLKNLALCGDNTLYNDKIREFSIRPAMLKLLGHPNKDIALNAAICFLSPKIYAIVLRILLGKRGS